MTAKKSVPSIATAPWRAVADDDSCHRLGEIRQHGESFDALDRRGQPIGSFDSADAAIEAARKAAGLVS
jgi:hypothetical protein